MSYRDILKPQLEIDEGKRRKLYKCSADKWSIGIGRNLEDNGLRDDEIALMLENDITAAEQDARKLVPNFDELSPARQAVVVNMSFNLGYSRLAGFKQTLAFIAAEKFEAAAEAMLQSKWAEQVGERAKRLAAQMRKG